MQVCALGRQWLGGTSGSTEQGDQRWSCTDQSDPDLELSSQPSAASDCSSEQDGTTDASCSDPSEDDPLYVPDEPDMLPQPRDVRGFLPLELSNLDQPSGRKEPSSCDQLTTVSAQPVSAQDRYMDTDAEEFSEAQQDHGGRSQHQQPQQIDFAGSEEVPEQPTEFHASAIAAAHCRPQTRSAAHQAPLQSTMTRRQRKAAASARTAASEMATRAVKSCTKRSSGIRRRRQSDQSMSCAEQGSDMHAAFDKGKAPRRRLQKHASRGVIARIEDTPQVLLNLGADQMSDAMSHELPRHQDALPSGMRIKRKRVLGSSTEQEPALASEEKPSRSAALTGSTWQSSPSTGLGDSADDSSDGPAMQDMIICSKAGRLSHRAASLRHISRRPSRLSKVSLPEAGSFDSAEDRQPRMLNYAAEDSEADASAVVFGGHKLLCPGTVAGPSSTGSQVRNHISEHVPPGSAVNTQTDCWIKQQLHDGASSELGQLMTAGREGDGTTLGHTAQAGQPLDCLLPGQTQQTTEIGSAAKIAVPMNGDAGHPAVESSSAQLPPTDSSPHQLGTVSQAVTLPALVPWHAVRQPEHGAATSENEYSAASPPSAVVPLSAVEPTPEDPAASTGPQQGPDADVPGGPPRPTAGPVAEQATGAAHAEHIEHDESSIIASQPHSRTLAGDDATQAQDCQDPVRASSGQSQPSQASPQPNLDQPQCVTAAPLEKRFIVAAARQQPADQLFNAQQPCRPFIRRVVTASTASASNQSSSQHCHDGESQASLDKVQPQLDLAPVDQCRTSSRSSIRVDSTDQHLSSVTSAQPETDNESGKVQRVNTTGQQGNAGRGNQESSPTALREIDVPVPSLLTTTPPEPAPIQADTPNATEAGSSPATTADGRRVSQADLRHLKKGAIAGPSVSGFEMVVGSVRSSGITTGRRDIMWRWTPSAPCTDPGRWLRSRPERDAWIEQHNHTQTIRESAVLPKKWKQIEAVRNGLTQSPAAVPRRLLQRQSLMPSDSAQHGPVGPEKMCRPALSSGLLHDARQPAEPEQQAAEILPSENAAEGDGSQDTERPVSDSGRSGARRAKRLVTLKRGDRTGRMLEGFEQIFWRHQWGKQGVYYWRPTGDAWAPAPPTKRVLASKRQLQAWLQKHQHQKPAHPSAGRSSILDNCPQCAYLPQLQP